MRWKAVSAFVLAAGLVNLALIPGAGSAEAPRRDGTVARAIDIALDHARDRRPARLAASDVADLVVTSAYTSAHNGVTHVYLRQRVGGIEVVGADMTVNVTRDGDVLYAPSRFRAGIVEAASGAVERSAVQAVRDAASELGLRVRTPLEVLAGPSGAARRTLVSDGGLALSPIPVKLVYQPAGRALRLAWSVEIEEVSQEHWWNARIDAQTGELLATDDYVDHEDRRDTAAAVGRSMRRAPAIRSLTPDPVDDGSSYRVFALPLESPNDGDRTLVHTPADALGSPYGWHDTNGTAGPEFTTTQGNNVHAYLDTTNTGAGQPLMDANGGSGLDFDFLFNPDLPPTANKDAAVTNLFYWNNIIHDAFYRYGFTESAGNFQVNNYGRGGAGNDSVRAEAQDGSGTNNANFATPADGSRPRMQMYVWTTGVQSQRRIIDGDFDAGVIIHEYGHGISNRLTGGPNTTGCLGNQEQMGEGWSDWLAIALTALPTESGPQRRGMGTYVLAQPNRQGAGIRPTPYSTNMSINGATYDTIKTAAVPHGVGYVWSTMLWEVFWDLVAKHGFNPNVYEDWTTGGNNLAIQLVMDGMKMQPCSPGFVTGRNAILAADQALTGGQNRCVIWRGFAKRGLGFSASQGASSSRSDGVQAFDTHPACRPNAEVDPAAVTVSVPADGIATASLTVRNTALVDGQMLAWSLSEAHSTCASPTDLAWLSADVREGTIPAAGSRDVTLTFDAAGVPSGATLEGRLCLGSNDPDTPLIAVPVTLSVE